MIGETLPHHEIVEKIGAGGMCRKSLLPILFLGALLLPPGHLFSMESASGSDSAAPPQTDSDAPERNAFLTLRLGVGGFSDSRSPDGILLGGQVVLDWRPFEFPVAVSMSLLEFYSGSSDPDHSYQIQNMGTLNLLYITEPFDSRPVRFFCGGGIVGLQVPRDDPGHEDDYSVGFGYDIEAGANYRLSSRMGVYAAGKYLYAQKEKDSTKVIDFSELILVIGATFNFDF